MLNYGIFIQFDATSPVILLDFYDGFQFQPHFSKAWGPMGNVEMGNGPKETETRHKQGNLLRSSPDLNSKEIVC